MAEIDFISAFARLLQDGKLRTMFAGNPLLAAEHIRLRRSDWPAWQQLVPVDVEYQATVLIHKRLDLVKFFAPETCRRIGEKLWPAFSDFSHTGWPAVGSAKIQDAFHFCRHLKATGSPDIVPAEWNRLAFALSKQTFALHWVKKTTPKHKIRPGLQLFLRRRNDRWHEVFFHFGL